MVRGKLDLEVVGPADSVRLVRGSLRGCEPFMIVWYLH